MKLGYQTTLRDRVEIHGLDQALPPVSFFIPPTSIPELWSCARGCRTGASA